MFKMERNKWLIAGIISFLGVCILNLGDWIESPVPAFFYSLLLIATLCFHLQFYRGFVGKQQAFNVEQVFGTLIQVGLVCLTVSFLPEIFYWIYGESEFFRMALELVGYYAFLHFVLFAVFRFRKLSELYEEASIRQHWLRFLIVLTVAPFTYLMDFEMPVFIVSLILVTGLLVMLFLLIRIKWIAFINFRIKWLSILFLLILNLVLLGIMQNVISYELPYVILDNVFYNIFFILILLYIVGYSVISILALLFNMPIASVTEKRTAEIQSYQAINKSTLNKDSSEETFKLLFRICYNDTLADGGWLTLAEREQKTGEVFHTNEVTEEEIKRYNEGIDLKRLLLKENLEKHYYFSDLSKNAAFAEEKKYQSLLVLPVLAQGKVLGSICLVKSLQGGFDEYQIQLAQSFVDTASLAFENKALVKSSVESERYRQELDIARRVQKQLIPTNFPDSELFEISGFCESAFEVGGDYYDFIVLDEDRMAVIVADVSGSGTSAAFYMAHLKGIYQSLAQLNLPVATFLEFTNEALSRCLEKKIFITLTYALFDFREQNVVYGRAGHTPVLYYSNELNEAHYLEDEGLGLGIVRDNSYAQFVKVYEQPFEKDDVFVFFTDGIVEGRNGETQEEFGAERLRICVDNHADTSALTLKKLILQDFYQFTNSDNGADDHSLVIVKVK